MTERIVPPPSEKPVERADSTTRLEDYASDWQHGGKGGRPDDETRRQGVQARSTWFGKAGDITKKPPVWVGIAAALAMAGPRGRQAAKRGAVRYVAGAGAHLAVKLIVGRSRPPGASSHTSIGPITSSFPSGDCASELAFSLGVAQELIGERPIGALDLYADTPHSFEDEDRAAALFATHAAVAFHAARERVQLEQALSSRDVIGQAKGILMAQSHITADEAFDLLRRASQRLNRKLVSVAEDIVDKNKTADLREGPGASSLGSSILPCPPVSCGALTGRSW